MLSIIYILIFGLLFLFIYNIFFPSKEGLSGNANYGKLLAIYEKTNEKKFRDETITKAKAWLKKSITMQKIFNYYFFSMNL